MIGEYKLCFVAREQHAGTKIPTLEELMALADELKLQVFLEVKTNHREVIGCYQTHNTQTHIVHYVLMQALPPPVSCLPIQSLPALLIQALPTVVDLFARDRSLYEKVSVISFYPSFLLQVSVC